VSEPVVVMPVLGDPVNKVWEVFLDLTERLHVAWTIVGGQMVLLHALEHGTVPPTVSQDGDVIADVRATQNALRHVAAELEQMGFALAGIANDGTAHRYRRDSRDGGRRVTIDVLAPDGVGERTDLTTTPPGHSLQVPAGSQALRRTKKVGIQVGDRLGQVPRPSLLGAIVAKAAACGIAGDSSRHYRDLAFLCSLVQDPFDLRSGLTKSDRRNLRLASPLDNSNHIAWLQVPENARDSGRNAWAILQHESR
jgi:hypothetical protein